MRETLDRNLLLPASPAILAVNLLARSPVRVVNLQINLPPANPKRVTNPVVQAQHPTAKATAPSQRVKVTLVQSQRVKVTLVQSQRVKVTLGQSLKAKRRLNAKKRKSEKRSFLSKSQSSKSSDGSSDDSASSKKSKKEIIYCDELEREHVYDELIPGEIIHDISGGEEEDANFESEASAADHTNIDKDEVIYNGINPFEHDFDLANVVTEPNEEYETHRKPPNCPCFGSDDIDDVIGKLLRGHPYSYDADMTCTGGNVDGIEVFFEHSGGYKTIVGLGVSTFAQEHACHQGDQLIILKQEDSEICRRILARKCDEHKSKLTKAKAAYSYLL